MGDKPKPPDIRVINPIDGFTQIPRFWMDRLMGSNCHKPKTGNAAPSVPASFWKFTIVLWRHITNGNDTRSTSMSMRQFPVRGDAAVRWTAAYSVSGLYEVEMGKYTAAHDQPTHFQYICAATNQEWEIFVVALDLVLNRLKDRKIEGWGNVGGFRVELAKEVDRMRVQAGLPSANEAFLRDAPKMLDSKNRPIASFENGEIKGLFYEKAKRASI